MGIACKINRNSSGNPTSVVLESGEKSKLFQDALDIVKDPNAALEIYATSLTETFKEEVLDPLKASYNSQLEARLKDSKVRDEKGTLKKVYHGSKTGRNFEKISVSSGEQQTDDGWLGAGAYFHPDKSVADAYSGLDIGNPQGRSFEVYLNLKNPYSFKGKSPYDMKKEHGGAQGLTDFLKSQGYDGATNGFEYVVFEEESIIQEVNSDKLDSNGEPKLETVTKYITSKNWEDKKLDQEQTRDIKKALQTIPNFRGKVAAAFYSKGIFSIDKASMVSSGLYSVAEANNILSNPELQNKVRSTIEGFMNTSDDQLGVKFQIGGETGARRLDAKDESTHRMDNLELARDMEANEANIASIKAATGWERGTDGKWRYEVEHDAVVAEGFDLDAAFESSEPTGLVELIGRDNPILEMYPEIGEIQVVFTDSFIQGGQEQLSEDAEGFYNNEFKVIVFNSRRMSPKDITKINSTLVHEVQHAIQYTEGFAVGGNTTTLFKNEGLIDSNGYLDRFPTMIYIQKRKFELESRIEALKREAGSQHITKELLEETGLLEEAMFLSGEMEALAEWSRFPQSRAYAERYYYRLSGETEARNAEKRAGMPYDARRNSPLSLTSDVSIEDQIIMFGRENNYSNNYSLNTSFGLDTKAMFKPIVDRLALSGLAADVKIVNSKEVEELFSGYSMLHSISAETAKNAKGFVLEGKVYLNSDNMTLDTPIHEFGHLWIGWAAKNKPALYARGIELIRSSGQRYIDSVRKSQPDLVGELVYEEALAEAIGDQGAKFILANEKKDYKSWIETLWNVLKDALGLSNISNDRISNMSLEEFSQAVAVDLMNGTNMPFKTRKYTIQPLLDKMLANKQGKMVSTQTIMQIVKQKGTKKIEKDIIEEILALPAFKGKGKIPFNQFEAEVQDKLMELTVIETSTYNTYGSNITGMHFDEQKTHIFNSGLDHGKKGHFNSDFGGYAPKKFEVREIQGTFVVVDADATLTQANIQDNVYHASSTREGAEEWVNNFTRDGKINIGLFGHTRVWYSGETAYLAELQSDTYQKAKAEEMLMDSYRRDPSTMNTKQRELMAKYDAGIKTIANASPHSSLMANQISEVMESLGKEKRKLKDIEEHNGDTPTERGLQELAAKKDSITELETRQKALFSIAAGGKAPKELPSYKTESGELVYTDLTGRNKLAQKGKGWVYTRGFDSNVLDAEDFEAVKAQLLRDMNMQYSNFPAKEYEAYFYAQKDLPKISAQIIKAASVQDQQWIAHRKNYTERLLREEIRMSAEKGYKTLSIPTPRTLALIEGYSSENTGGEGAMPYEVEGGGMEDLREGDIITYDGVEHVVVEADSYRITVVDRDYYYSEDINDMAEQEADYYVGEEMYQLNDHWGKVLTEEEYYDLDKPWFADNLDFEDVTNYDEEADTYTLDQEKFENLARENFMESFDAYEEITNRGGSYLSESYGGTISYVADGGDTETFMQPDQYEQVASEDEFDIDDYPEDQQTVLRKYEELQELFKKERGENAFPTEDSSGNSWLSTSLTSEDGVQPVILFQMPRVEQKPLTDFFKGDKDTNKVSNLGTYESKNPHLLEKEAVQELGGIKDRAEFEERLQSSEFETLKIKYNQDQIFAEEFFKRMSSLSRIREFKIGESGLERKNTVDTAELFEETLTTAGLKISEQIVFLEGLPSDIWRNNSNEIITILEGVRRMAVDMGLNLRNLEDYYTERSQDELINLLIAVKNVNLQPNKSRLSELTEAYDKFFETEKKRSVQVTTVPESHKDKSLIYLDTTVGEYEVFEKHSLIKVRGNLYQKVKKVEGVESLYEQLTAVEMSQVLGNKDVSAGKVKDRIKREIEEKASSLAVQGAKGEELLKMAAYQYHFRTERTSKEEVDTTKELVKYSNFTGDAKYLTGEFVADFNKASIKAEQGVGKAYEEFYSNFEISEKGIVLKNTDEITMETVRDYIKGGTLGRVGENLVQYSILSKESGLDIIGEAESKIKTDEFYRDFYVNNPEQAPKVSTYTNVDTGVIAAKGAPKFIMTSKGLFEAVSELGNVGFYAKLPSSSKYNQINVEQPELTIDVSRYSHLQSIPKSTVRVSNKLTKAEEQRINNEQFNC